MFNEKSFQKNGVRVFCVPDRCYNLAMHIDVVPNRTSRPAHLLRESFREGKKVRKRTLTNLSSFSDEQLLAIRAVLQGDTLYPVEALFEVVCSRPEGHVEAVRVAMSRMEMPALLAARPSCERMWCWRWWPRAFWHRRPSWRRHAGGIRRPWPKTVKPK
jgi:hypothetical protein